MASKRTLKRNVKYVMEELLTECMVCRYVVPGVDEAKVNELIDEILDMRKDFVCRISHPEPNETASFYKKYYEDFNKRLETIIEKLNNLNKRSE